MIALNHKDFIGGVLIVALGVFVCYSAYHFGIGDASRMGPGYTPAIIGAGMLVTGAAIASAAFHTRDPLPGVAWRPVIAVILGMSAFAATAGNLGLIPAVMLLVGISALGDKDSRPLTTLLLSVSIAVGMWLVFVVGLRVSLPAIRWDF